MRIYFYKLTVDDGGAPCVQDDVLSLAICKPMIRSTAEPGDLIFGFAANSLGRDNALIYVARVTEKLRHGEYYLKRKYARRSDCIYQWRGGRFAWRHGALYHGSRHLERDLGPPPDYAKANVLLSNDFRYFGRAATAEYKSSYPLVVQALKRLGQGHRVWHRDGLRRELLDFQHQAWVRNPRVSGEPMTPPRLGACHRSRSCEVLF